MKNRDNFVFPEDKDSVWLPWLEELNVESGESCKRSPTVEVIAVHPNENFTHEKSPYTDAQNSILFKGSENMIYQQWDWTCKHICIFNYLWYPFDTQNCPIILNNTLQSFQIKDNHIWYSGDSNLERYYFHSIGHCEEDKLGRSGLFIDFVIKRPVLHNTITLYLPTSMLLLISQMSTAFSKAFRELVIEVNTTLLLVLTTL